MAVATVFSLGSIAATGGFSAAGVALSTGARATLVAADLGIAAIDSLNVLNQIYDSCYGTRAIATGKVCSPEEGMSAVLSKSSTFECASQVAGAALPGIVALGSAAGKAARAERAVENVTDVERAASRQLENANEEIVVRARNGVKREVPSNTTDYAPISRASTINSDMISQTHLKEVTALRNKGAQFHESSANPQMQDLMIRKEVTVYPSGGRTDYGKVLVIDQLPPAGRSRSPLGNALTHPDMSAYKQRLEEMGYDLTVDTGMKHTGAAAYFMPGSRISLDSSSTWEMFLHEFQHAEFDYYIRGSNLTLAQGAVQRGLPLSQVLGPQAIAEIGGQQKANRLQELLQKGLSENSINETLSVDAQLKALGFRRYKPGVGSGAEQYALRHQITDLQALEKRTAIQEQTLQQAIRRFDALGRYDRRADVAIQMSKGAAYAAVPGGAAVAGVVAYSNSKNSQNRAPQVSPLDYKVIIYNERGKAFGQRPDGKWVPLQKVPQN